LSSIRNSEKIVKVARIIAFIASRWLIVRGLLITPSFTNSKDYTAEMLCEEADIISLLRENRLKH
jgi:hypothetical protein